MIEKEAKSKLCPFKMGLVGVPMNERGCDGSGCMGWDVHVNVQVDGKWVSVKEPSGECGMKPPEEINANVQY